MPASDKPTKHNTPYYLYAIVRPDGLIEMDDCGLYVYDNYESALKFVEHARNKKPDVVYTVNQYRFTNPITRESVEKGEDIV